MCVCICVCIQVSQNSAIIKKIANFRVFFYFLKFTYLSKKV